MVLRPESSPTSKHNEEAKRAATMHRHNASHWLTHISAYELELELYDGFKVVRPDSRWLQGVIKMVARRDQIYGGYEKIGDTSVELGETIRE